MADSKMITVKKKDGTRVRMTLEEFRAYKKNGEDSSTSTGNQSNTNATTQLPEPKKEDEHDELMVLGEQHLAEPINTEQETRSKKPASQQGGQETKNTNHVARNTDQEARNLPRGKAGEKPASRQGGESISNAGTDEMSEDMKKVMAAIEKRSRANSLGLDSKKKVVRRRKKQEKNSTEKGANTMQQKVPAQNSKEPNELGMKVDRSKNIQTEQWDDEDHLSPLLEEAPKDAADHKKVAQMDHVGEVMDSVPFALPEELHSRLQSLVTSRRKGIRTNDQLQEYFIRATDQGGLGLTQEQAVLLLKAVQEVYRLTPQNKAIPAPKRAPVESENQEHSSAATAAAQPPKDQQQNQQMDTPKQAPLSGPAKPVLHDVIAQNTPYEIGPKKVETREMYETVGPVGEIGNMTLEDFTRLAPSIENCAAVVLQKINNLKKESATEYERGRRAWFGSPVNMRYLDILKKSLQGSGPVSALLQEEGEMSEEIFDTIVFIHKQLSRG
jgi:hypothetical protein